MLSLGIVGLPNVGKSSLFNALTAAKADAANYPFCTVEPNVGMVNVPDPRLDRLADIVKPERTLPAVVQFVDIAGLVKGASQGEGLGNKFLAHIRESAAICQVTRVFRDEDVTHVDGEVNPANDISTIQTELILADLETVEKRFTQAQRQAKLDKGAAGELDALQAAYDALSEGKPLYRAGLKPEWREQLQPYFLLTNRSVLAVVNVGENELDRIPEVEARVRDEFQQRRVGIQMLSKSVIPVSLAPAGNVSSFSAARGAEAGILLSTSPDKNGEVAVLMRDGSFSQRQALDMTVRGKTYYLMPSKMVEGGDDYDHARFKIMKRE